MIDHRLNRCGKLLTIKLSGSVQMVPIVRGIHIPRSTSGTSIEIIRRKLDDRRTKSCDTNLSKIFLPSFQEYLDHFISILLSTTFNFPRILGSFHQYPVVHHVQIKVVPEEPIHRIYTHRIHTASQPRNLDRDYHDFLGRRSPYQGMG